MQLYIILIQVFKCKVQSECPNFGIIRSLILGRYANLTLQFFPKAFVSSTGISHILRYLIKNPHNT